MDTKWNPASGTTASRNTDKGILIRGDDGVMRPHPNPISFEDLMAKQQARYADKGDK